MEGSTGSTASSEGSSLDMISPRGLREAEDKSLNGVFDGIQQTGRTAVTGV
jgi:hypothetical protein